MGISDGIRLYSALPRFDEARTWAEIDLGALRFNYKYLTKTLEERATQAGFKRPEPICVVKAGETVSYGGVYTAERDTRIATLPVGYADGFLRAYGGARVMVSTKDGDVEAPIVGRICMDQCMISLEGLEGASVGDEVTLFGDTPNRLYDLAKLADTIPYEILCAVSARVVRIYKEDGDVL